MCFDPPLGNFAPRIEVPITTLTSQLIFVVKSNAFQPNCLVAFEHLRVCEDRNHIHHAKGRTNQPVPFSSVPVFK